MHARTMSAVIGLFVLLSLVGRGFDSQPRTVSAAAPPAEPKSVDSPLPAPAIQERVYEVHKKVSDFPDGEDLSTPEAAHATIERAYAAEGNKGPFWRRLSVPEVAEYSPVGVKQPLPNDRAEIVLSSEIIEVYVWDETFAVVIARSKAGGVTFTVDTLGRVGGQWLNAGGSAASTLEGARTTVLTQFRSRYVARRLRDAAKRLRDNRPPVADPAAHLQPFVDFLNREAKDPQEFVLDAIEKHRVVILSEIHHRPRYWAFNTDLVRSPEFAHRAGVIYLELPSNDQPLVDRFLAANEYDPEPVVETLRDTNT